MRTRDGNLDDLISFAAAALASGQQATILSAEPVAVRLTLTDGVETRSFLAGLADIETVDFG